MFVPRWDSWSDTARREALAVAVVLATTFGGWTTNQAAADESPAQPESPPPAAVAPVEEPEDPVEAVFSFRDTLDRVQWQLGFEPAARNGDELTSACETALRDRPTFEAALDEAGDELAADLRSAVAPMMAFCEAPSASSAQREAAALDGYRRFWEAAYDFDAA